MLVMLLVLVLVDASGPAGSASDSGGASGCL